MKKYITIFLLLWVCCYSANAQNPVWGNWSVPDACLKGIHARVKMVGVNNFAQGAAKYMWVFSIFNGYGQPISFDLNLLSPQGYAAFQSGERKELEGFVGRITVQPNQSLDWGGFEILLPTTDNVHFWIRNVRFGDDNISAPYANDECGHATGDNSSVSDGSSNTGDISQTDHTQQQAQPPSTSGDISQPAADKSTTSKPAAAHTISFPRVTASGNNVNVQNAINNINNAQSATDAIAQTTYLNQADLTLMYEQTHGNNTPQVQQLRQQIAQLQRQYNQQNAAALQNSINNAFGGSTNNNTGLQGAISDIMSKNDGWENGNAQQKTEIKKSMNDFFNNVNFDKPDTAKRDTTKKKPIKP